MSLRVTISESLAEMLLDLFQETLEAGGRFDQKSLDDYDKFRNSVVKAKRHKVRLRSDDYGLIEEIKLLEEIKRKHNG